MKSKLKFIALPVVLLFVTFVLLDSDEAIVTIPETETEISADVETEISDIASEIATAEVGQKDYHAESIPINFQTKTVYDKEINSDIFADYDMTVMNIWATWCGPCVNEMPDLQVVYENLPENVNFLSLCTDGVSQNADARTILDGSGATFDSILPDALLTAELLPAISAYPTTIFIDKWGYAFTAISGAPPTDVADVYLATIDDVLAELSEMT